MDWTLRELRCFVAVARTGSLTAAASELHVSQAAVSRTIASLERTAGCRLLRRLARGCELTGAGHQVLPHAQRVLSEADRLSEFLATRHEVLRLGYAWAALGKHTVRLQRQWPERHPTIELELVRHNSPTAGVAEGLCDVAVVRNDTGADADHRFATVVVGIERRFVAFASDDPHWSNRRQLTMAEIAGRAVVVDPRVGTTSSDLWTDGERPSSFLESTDIDGWLDTIAAARGVGTTAEATAHHHPRPGVTYRSIKDGPRIAVRHLWWRDQPPPAQRHHIDAATTH
jgi:DNA-binding transcriptional LysR family regulator